ncbi:MAG: hypothetical protein IJL71_00585 [Oscillospiraceae bacterium]|nr:hypothetical protein [Oscillospiraceae bacterium]
MKKIILILMIMLLLCGCSSALNGSQEYVSPHNSAGGSDAEPTYTDVANYYELRTAMLDLVKDHKTEGMIRFTTYNGDIEKDLNNACIYITNDTAIGSYSVSYVGSSLNRFVSYYEANISVIYKKDISETSKITEIYTVDSLKEVMRDMLDKCTLSLAVQTGSYNIDQTTFEKVINELYYDDPQLIVAFPKMEIAEYSDTNGSTRIYDVSMTYAFDPSEMLGRKNVFDTILEQLSYKLHDTDDEASLLYQLCTDLSESAEVADTVPDEKYDPFDTVNTAYGALYERKASGEGFAMAMKLLCNWKDIDCMVVTGRYNNYIHAWNIIKVDNEWYHFDISRLEDGASVSLMLTDRQMEGSYSWDVSQYPACNGNLDYTYLTSTVNTETPPESPSDETVSDENDTAGVPEADSAGE